MNKFETKKFAEKDAKLWENLLKKYSTYDREDLIVELYTSLSSSHSDSRYLLYELMAFHKDVDGRSLLSEDMWRERGIAEDLDVLDHYLDDEDMELYRELYKDSSDPERRCEL